MLTFIYNYASIIRYIFISQKNRDMFGNKKFNDARELYYRAETGKEKGHLGDMINASATYGEYKECFWKAKGIGDVDLQKKSLIGMLEECKTKSDAREVWDASKGIDSDITEKASIAMTKKPTIAFG